MLELHCCHPRPVQVHAGLHCDHGKGNVSYQNRETKKQSKQWIPKGELAPLKALVHTNQTKQMVMAFFNSGGLIYTLIISRGAAINATSTIKALGKFLEHFKKKGPTMAQQQ